MDWSASVAEALTRPSKAETIQHKGNAIMKMTAEHYEHMKSAILPNAKNIKAHRAFLIGENKSKDVEKRLRWDLSYAAGLTGWICSNLYSYLDDTHIDTALRSIVREIEPQG